MSLLRHWSITLLAACCTACGAAVPSERVDLDPLVLRTKEGGSVELVDPRTLFEEASHAYQGGRYDQALRKFELVLELFPDSRYAPHARFNAGLALVRLGRWDDALRVFTVSAEQMHGTDDEWDARYQKTICLEKLGRWSDLLFEVQPILERAKPNVTQRIEAMARHGIALFHLDRLAEAEEVFERVLEQSRQNAGVPSLTGNAHVAQVQYLVGEIYRGLFGSIRFRLPVESMKRDLQDKSSFFLKGQSAYLRTIRLQNNYWSVAAGYKLGRLYEDFYQDMMEAEIPAELDADDRQVYFEELKKHIRPLVIRAIDIYERNLGMSDRLGPASEWTKKTQASLERMRTVLRTELAEPGLTQPASSPPP